MDKSLELCTVFGFIFLITGCSLFFPNESVMQGQNGYYNDNHYHDSMTGYSSGYYMGDIFSSNATAHNGYGHQHKIPSDEKYRLVLPHTAQQSKHQHEIQTNPKQVEGQTQASTRQTNGDAAKLESEEKQQQFLRNQQQMQNNYQQQQRQNEYASEIAHKVQETNYQIESNIRKAEYDFAKKQQEVKKREEEEQQAIRNQVHQIQIQQVIQNQGWHFPGR